jgi:acetyltransferase-like isoleucine patch superfamily enzyme
MTTTTIDPRWMRIATIPPIKNGSELEEIKIYRDLDGQAVITLGGFPIERTEAITRLGLRWAVSCAQHLTESEYQNSERIAGICSALCCLEGEADTDLISRIACGTVSIGANVNIDPSAKIGYMATVGHNCKLSPNSVIRAHARVLPNCNIGEHATVEDHCLVECNVQDGKVHTLADCNPDAEYPEHVFRSLWLVEMYTGEPMNDQIEFAWVRATDRGHAVRRCFREIPKFLDVITCSEEFEYRELNLGGDKAHRLDI